MAAPAIDKRSVTTNPFYSGQLRKFAGGGLVTLFATLILTGYLSPFAYMVTTALKSESQIKEAEIFPWSPETAPYGPAFFQIEEDKRLTPIDEETFGGLRNSQRIQVKEGVYPIYRVPTPDGEKEMVLVGPRNTFSYFYDPEDPEGDLFYWEGFYQTLPAVKFLDPQLDNFETAWNGINFPRLLFNTSVIAVLGLIGTVVSCVSVAYAFARFPLPYKNVLFLILISTIVLPRQVTLVPTYAFFSRIGWTGTWLPLIVPHFFANAYNVFLLRQFFRTLPRELDEAAMIDGAGPLRILWSVIIPQSYPAIVAVSLFHFVFAWNDYFEPLIYTLGKRNLVPISVGIQQFNFIFDQDPHLIQATSIMGLVLPVLLFFFAQRVFMRGIVVTGVDK